MLWRLHPDQSQAAPGAGDGIAQGQTLHNSAIQAPQGQFANALLFSARECLWTAQLTPEQGVSADEYSNREILACQRSKACGKMARGRFKSQLSTT